MEPEDDDRNDTVDDGDNIELDINKDDVDTIKLNDGVDITKSEIDNFGGLDICDGDKDRSKLETDEGLDIVTDGAAKVDIDKDGTGTPELENDVVEWTNSEIGVEALELDDNEECDIGMFVKVDIVDGAEVDNDNNGVVATKLEIDGDSDKLDSRIKLDTTTDGSAVVDTTMLEDTDTEDIDDETTGEFVEAAIDDSREG